MKLLERRAANLRLNEPAAYRVAAIGYGVRRWALASPNPSPITLTLTLILTLTLTLILTLTLTLT